MAKITPYNETAALLSDQALIEIFHAPQSFRKVHLYSVLAERAAYNDSIKSLLFNEIIDEYNRNYTITGIIKMAWLPVFSILDYADLSIKLELRDLIQQWSTAERDFFLFYIKQEKELLNFFL